MTPLIVIAPCGCKFELDGRHVQHRAWPEKGGRHTRKMRSTFLPWINALRANPSLAYSLARAGYAMAKTGVGRG